MDKYKFEFSFEDAITILRLIDSGPHNKVRPIVDYMMVAINEQQKQQQTGQNNEQLPEG